MSDVFVFSASPIALVPSSLISLHGKPNDKQASFLSIYVFLRSSLISDLFVFSASPIVLAPPSPTPLCDMLKVSVALLCVKFLSKAKVNK